MSRAYYLSDPHIDHKNIGKFRDVTKESWEQAQIILGDDAKYLELSCLANTLMIGQEVRARVKKRDTLHILGDATWTEKGLAEIATWPGRKVLYGGNHDDLSVHQYLEVFDEVRGCKKVSKLGWFSHFPTHPNELRGHFSNHGHVHTQTVDDWRYVNLCCDNVYKEVGQFLITREDLLATHAHRREHKDLKIVLDGAEPKEKAELLGRSSLRDQFQKKD